MSNGFFLLTAYTQVWNITNFDHHVLIISLWSRSCKNYFLSKSWLIWNLNRYLMLPFFQWVGCSLVLLMWLLFCLFSPPFCHVLWLIKFFCFSVTLYLHFATSVIHEITTALGICCFRWVFWLFRNSSRRSWYLSPVKILQSRSVHGFSVLNVTHFFVQKQMK